MHFPVARIFQRKKQMSKDKRQKVQMYLRAQLPKCIWGYKSPNGIWEHKSLNVFVSTNPQNEQNMFIKITLRKTQNSNSKYLFIRNMP